MRIFRRLDSMVRDCRRRVRESKNTNEDINEYRYLLEKIEELAEEIYQDSFEIYQDNRHQRLTK